MWKCIEMVQLHLIPIRILKSILSHFSHTTSLIRFLYFKKINQTSLYSSLSKLLTVITISLISKLEWYASQFKVCQRLNLLKFSKAVKLEMFPILYIILFFLPSDATNKISVKHNFFIFSNLLFLCPICFSEWID